MYYHIAVTKYIICNSAFYNSFLIQNFALRSEISVVIAVLYYLFQSWYFIDEILLYFRHSCIFVKPFYIMKRFTTKATRVEFISNQEIIDRTKRVTSTP